MLALLPILALISLFVSLRLGWPSADGRRDLLRAALLWGAITLWLTQFLSWFSLVNALGLGLGWSFVGLAPLVAARAWRRSRWTGLGLHLPSDWGGFDWAASASIAIIMLGTAIVSRWAPPQTWDTLNYHMARVAHWAQMASVRPYATGIEIQNSMPPGAEMLFLQPYVLAAGDTWVNFVDWTAAWIAVLGVSLLAKQLGAGRRGQLLAALFLATTPMTIVQAGSTMTDIVLAVWLLGVTAELLAVGRRGDDAPAPFLFMAIGAGLAMVTKPTAFAYLLPLAVWAVVSLLRRRPLGRQLAVAVLGAIVVLSINAGYFSGNFRLYGNPVAPPKRVLQHGSPWLGGRAFVSNVLRNATYQLATPSPHVNKAIALSVIMVHRWMGLDASDPRTTAAGRYKVALPTTSEDLAQNPLQMAMFLAAGILFVKRRPTLGADLTIYVVMLIFAFMTFSLLYKWLVFGSRLLLPFFALAAPFVGTLADRHFGRRVNDALAAALLAACIPWLLGVKSRPLIARADDGHLVSILTSNRTDLYFANGPYLEKPYLDMTGLISDVGCQDVGLMLSGGQAEYPLWILLGAPDSGLDIEWIVAGTSSAKLAKPSFLPCAVILESDQPLPETINGLPLAYHHASFGLYLESIGRALQPRRTVERDLGRPRSLVRSGTIEKVYGLKSHVRRSGEAEVSELNCVAHRRTGDPAHRMEQVG
jgi:hypothetical protein